ncbi:hypothetical protein [Myceligenerans salitolerans]|uniref:Uncharacterized protein n=1 Tax=Myceligenerans salitolerans TaxID=1230528 RepID=A0ABS3I821_9MICO|nr:hypothetical protein [Myceligenerans salitolerans]MBO0608623.1 hypothetical protein [Myceligenerans salitolerans]
MSRTELTTGAAGSPDGATGNGDRPAVPSRSGRTLAGATALSGVAALLGGAWLAELVPGYYTHPGYALIADLAGAGFATVLHTVVALIGVASGIAGLAGALNRPALVAAGALQVAVLGLGMGSMGTLSVVGYLVAFSVPVVVVVLLVQVVRKYPRGRWTVGIPALALVTAAVVVAGPAITGALAASGRAVAGMAGTVGVVLLLLAIATAWGAVAVRAFAADGGTRRATAWVLRHRKAITVVAATGPLPYALMRLTWLTPWPVLSVEDLDMSSRVWGLLLSGGAWIGFVLTLGLILPWGEVFPRWVPGLAGKPVPIAAAAVPGGFVAATLTCAALPMLLAFRGRGADELLLSAVAFPCWYWGPALALAVWGYVAHRRGATA